MHASSSLGGVGGRLRSYARGCAAGPLNPVTTRLQRLLVPTIYSRDAMHNRSFSVQGRAIANRFGYLGGRGAWVRVTKIGVRSTYVLRVVRCDFASRLQRDGSAYSTASLSDTDIVAGVLSMAAHAVVGV